MSEPTKQPDPSNPSTEHGQSGDAARPSDRLDKDQPEGETIPRKSSLLPD